MSQPIQQGGRLGRYQLITRLATGGMAEVWLARATGAKGFQKTIVVKTILPHLADDPDFLRMFIDEALLAAALNHPNVVQIFDLGQIGEHYFIAMEFILGRTMRQVQRVLRKQRKVMPPWLVLRVAVAVCDALDYAHNRRGDDGELLGIVHRDVTPENIMISFSGVTKVVDFGIAKATTSASVTRAGKIKGKLAYLAPEQIVNAGKAPADRRTDIYALGVLLYEMLTGVRPFRAPNDMALLLKIPKEVPTPPSEIARWVPAQLSSIVMKAMHRDPHKRFQESGELGEALEGFLTSVGTYPTERHASAYMCKLFDEEERRIPTIATGSPSTGSGKGGGSPKSGGDEISGPDSAASISIEVSLQETLDKTGLRPTGDAEGESAEGESAEGAADSGEAAAAPRDMGADRGDPGDPGAGESVESSDAAADGGGLDLAALGDDWGAGPLASVEVPELSPSPTPRAAAGTLAVEPDDSKASDAEPAESSPDGADVELSIPAPAPEAQASSIPAPPVPAPSAPAPSVPSDPETESKEDERVARAGESSDRGAPALLERSDGGEGRSEGRPSSDPFIKTSSRTTAWDAIVERAGGGEAEESAEDLARPEGAMEAPDLAGEPGSAAPKGPRHAWDAVVERSRDVEEAEGEEPEVGRRGAVEREAAVFEPRDEKLHMWDAFIRGRSDHADGERSAPFPGAGGDERFRRETAWLAGQDSDRAAAAEKFDEGLEHVRQGRQEEALRVWGEAVGLDPENRKYRGNLRMLRKALSGDESE